MRGIVADGGDNDGKDVFRSEDLPCAAEPLVGALPRMGRPVVKLSEQGKRRNDSRMSHEGVSRLQDVGRVDVIVVRVGCVICLPDAEEERVKLICKAAEREGIAPV